MPKLLYVLRTPRAGNSLLAKFDKSQQDGLVAVLKVQWSWINGTFNGTFIFIAAAAAALELQNAILSSKFDQLSDHCRREALDISLVQISQYPYASQSVDQI